METDEIPNLELGQHFLIDERILDKEIDAANISETDKIIEIGAGKGELTNLLVKNSKIVLAFEKDSSLKRYLDKLKHKNLTIVYDDAMKYDWRNYNKIVSNIPYFLSGDLMLKAIKDNIQDIIIIVGEEFKDKLINKSGKIGFIANLFYNIIPVLEVDKNSFFPIPRVNSWLITLHKKQLNDSEKFLINVINREGKIKNSILYALVNIGKTKKQAKAMIDSMELSQQVLEKPTSKLTEALLIKIKESLNL
ncbi:MAG TPA: rRNA adenine dimethyltransferase family protein [Candidatus Nanoarchaeia archaeon]|nr:rRNA adenine dimethyltransferase family protein [Candidatus Nanoarchaeia archaeon]